MEGNRNRITHLLKRGVPRDMAISLGMSSKGWWKLSRTYATLLGMNNAWLARQGLVSIKERTLVRVSLPTMNRRSGPACPVVWEGRERSPPRLAAMNVYDLYSSLTNL
jgi:hypothetical protein